MIICGSVTAKAQEATIYYGSNINKQNYTKWSTKVNSYLTETRDHKLMRFQANALSTKKQYLVEYYDSSYHLVRTVNVPYELSLFGAFYDDGNNYYIFSGQNNSNEKNSVEVFRLTKYDYNWRRLGSVGVYGANTSKPFEAGLARIHHSGKHLAVKTCHTMYVTDEGYHHQSNMLIRFRTDTMTVESSNYSVSNISKGYVSHSFNQFVRYDGDSVVGVDHGDAYPRSVVLTKTRAAGSGCDYKEILAISGNVGNNDTGVSVGGFEISSSSYLVVGNSVKMGSGYSASGVRNIFVASVDRNLQTTPKLRYVTSYKNGDTSPSTPQFMKIDSGNFLLLWMKGSTLNYVKINANGDVCSNVYQVNAELSDCVPILYNGKIIWYTWKNEIVKFYSINPSTIITKNVSFSTASIAAAKQVVMKPKAVSVKKVSASKDSFTLQWKKGEKGVTGYQIQYSLKSNFTGKKTVTIKSAKTVKKKIGKLKSKKKYYIRIRCFKTVSGKKYYSVWSAKKSVKVK
ncbi:MAG: fibronectin type III domain-containing protein [Eubacteriales bacterium]|nr:fibronectin type III domain-containing protein [Eubacteriales bacterium]